MQNSPLQPFNRVLLAVLLFFSILYLGKPFLIPVAIGCLFAILLMPVASKMEKWGLSRPAASAISVIVLIIIFAAFFYFMTGQVISFVQDLPSIKNSLEVKLDNLHKYVDNTFGMPRDEQEEMLDSQVNNLFQRMGVFLTNLVYNAGSFLTYFFIVALYAYFFLSFRHRFKIFIFKLINRNQKNKTEDIFSKVATVANSYITGVALVVLILSVCNTIALSIIGVRQALFFGVLAGILNIIPFIGSMVGSFIPILILLLTRDSLTLPLAAGIYFLSIQLVESYFLTPNITGNKVKLNPMATIMALLLGALIWGVAGMILFIPYLGILKVLFDNIEPLTPFGYIIGNETKQAKKPEPKTMQQ